MQGPARKHPPTHAARSGFTLLELLLVMALIVLIVALVVPEFTTRSEREQLHEAARRFQALASMCRAEAMNEARRYRVTFRLDGTVRIERQLDPIKAPHIFEPVPESWAGTAVLPEDVWVEAIQIMPQGPPPIRIIDEELEFPEMEIEPLLLEEFERDVYLDFPPDGSCSSLRWILRDAGGRALLLTLDGRLGRVSVEPWPALPEEDVYRPEPLEEEEQELDYDLERYE